MESSKQLMLDTLTGKDCPRIPTGPLAVHYCAAFAGISVSDYTLNPEKMAGAVIKYYEYFRPDALWISADTWLTAEAMGASVAFPGKNLPLSGSGDPLISKPADIKKIKTNDILNRGRFPIMLEALQIVRKAVGDQVFIVGCLDQAPFSLACSLMGMEKAMTSLMTEPDFVYDLLEICLQFSSAYAMALAGAGADMLSTGDSPAGLIGREMYRAFALPTEQRLFRPLKKTGKYLSLHICGNTTPILADMAGAGAEILELDFLVDLQKACEIIPQDIAVWGNLNPLNFTSLDKKSLIEEELENVMNIIKKSKRKRFVLSSGCTLPVDSKAENVKLICERITL